MAMAALAFSASAPLDAKTLTPEEALARINSGRRMPSKIQKSNLVLSKTIMTKESNEEALYIFDDSKGNGFVVLSADDNFPAVVGYSERGTSLTGNVNAGLEWLLGEYAAQVEYARENNVSVVLTRGEGDDDKAPIEPLVKSKWDQNAPYYNNAPALKPTISNHSAAGCVAVALAQVMNYYKYPAVGTGTGSATWDGGTITEDLSTYPFDWNNILDTYEKGQYTEEQGKAVADLVYACGLAVNSTYARTTLAKTITDVTALCENFGYSKNLRYHYRDYVSTQAEWEDIVYGSLSRQCPVIYAGGDESGGGHSFVCDGYQGDGYFHINWGWGGDSDGYYLLNLLNPSDQGTGGTAAGYNDRQYVITDIRPAAEGETAEYQPAIFYYRGDFVFNNGKTFNGDGSSKGFYSRSPYEAEYFWGIHIVDSKGEGQFRMKEPKVYAYGKGVTGMTYSDLADDLEDGVYKIYPIFYADNDEDFRYIYHETGTNDYLIFTIENHVITNVEKGYNNEEGSNSGVDEIVEDAMAIVLAADNNGFSVKNVTVPTYVNVYSINGEKVLEAGCVTHDVEVSMDNLASGIYIVAATNRLGMNKLKLIKR